MSLQPSNRGSLPVPQALDPEIDAKVQEFTISCNNGLGPPVSCHQLGQFSSVVMQDFVFASKLYENACYISPAKARANLGEKQMLQGTVAIPKDKQHPYAYASSCFNLGKIFLGGRENCIGEELNRKPDYVFNDSYVEKLFSRACDGTEGKHFPSCHELAIMLMNGKGKGGREREREREKRAFKSVEITTPTAPIDRRLGMSDADFHHFSIPQDLPRALSLLKRNCTQENYSPSCSLLGEMLLTPNTEALEKLLGGERQPAQAAKFMEVACRGNDGKSCYNLAVLYKRGDKGVKADEGKFREFAGMANELISAERRTMEKGE